MSSPQCFFSLYTSCLQHEDASITMFEHLLDETTKEGIRIRDEMFMHGLNEKDIQFIKEQIKLHESEDGVSVHAF